jgi:hypothetical protein
MLKKLLLVALLCVGGYVAYVKTRRSKPEDLWADAVDRVNPGH